MGKRTYETDIVAMALLYVNECDGTGLLLYDKIIEFDNIINENLDEMNSSCGIGIRMENDNDNRLYFIAKDEYGNRYAIINPNANLKKAKEWHLGTLPLDVIIASQKSNALSVIGLELENGHFKKKQNKVKKKTLNRN